VDADEAPGGSRDEIDRTSVRQPAKLEAMDELG
jgi:hypothetical protein